MILLRYDGLNRRVFAELPLLREMVTQVGLLSGRCAEYRYRDKACFAAAVNSSSDNVSPTGRKDGGEVSGTPDRASFLHDNVPVVA